MSKVDVRNKKVKGTKDFLVAAVACGFLCLWATRDAWFPTQNVLKKHPLEFAVTNRVPGVVSRIPVKVGEEVAGEEPLIILAAEQYEKAVTVAKEDYKAAVETNDKELMKAKLEILAQAEEALKATTLRPGDFVLETTHGKQDLKGKVLNILVEPATHVDPGQPVMVIQPADTFYIFNQTLAVLTFAGMIVSLFFHRVASK